MWCQAVTELRGVYLQASIETLCGLFGKSRQAYYKWHPREFRNCAIENIVLEEARRIRSEAPGMGAYKIYLILLDVFGRENMPGRDAFYSLMRKHGLNVEKRKTHRTTNSYHHFHKWSNLIKGYTPEAPNRLFVSDITYITTSSGVCYLHLVTDAFSRRIMGWCLASTLQASKSLEALDMALSAASAAGADLSLITHHSDRGIQYCSHLYVARLKSIGASISMTEDSNPTDNAIAERVNGILKNEYLEGRSLTDLMDAYSAISRAVNHYNGVRPHMSLGYKTPDDVFKDPACKGAQKWKKRTFAPRPGTEGGENHNGIVAR